MIISELFEAPQLCPECGGISFSDLILAEKKDACYYKVKASAKVWPSAYASGRLVQCRKKGAANYGKSKNEGVAEGSLEEVDRRGFLKGLGAAAVAGAAGGANADWERQQDFVDKLSGDKEIRFVNISPDSEYFLRFVSTGQGPVFYIGGLNFHSQNTGKGRIKIDNGKVHTISFVPTNDKTSLHSSKIQPLDVSISDLSKEIFSAKQKILIDVTEITPGAPEERQRVATFIPKFSSKKESVQQGVAEQQELDEKWSQKYKKSINCANPKGFSQRAHCAGRKKNEDVEESLGKQIHSTFQTMGDTFSDAHLAKGISYFLQGRHQEGENWLRGKIPPEAQAAVFGKLKTLQAQGGVDVNKNPNVQQYIDNKLVPWVKNQIQQNVKEGGDVFMPNIKDTAEYKAGLATGKLPVPYPEGTQQYASYYKGVIDRASPTLAKVGEEVEPTDDGAFSTWSGGMRVSGPNAYEKARQLDLDSFAEGEQQKGADYRDPTEADYGPEYQDMVARVKKLAGLGPMKTVYDPKKRVYKNVPTAQQPKK